MFPGCHNLCCGVVFRLHSQVQGVPNVSRKPTTAHHPLPSHMPKSPEYGSDDDLFSDKPKSGGSTDPDSHHLLAPGRPFTQNHCTQRDAPLRTVAQCDTPQALTIPDPGCGRGGKQAKLRSVEEIPERYRDVFNFPYFNIVQSLVLDDVLYTDKPMVVCAPTGSGKTAVFELAILRLLMTAATQNMGQIKIVYMAPIKALCSERYLDWRDKFEPFGLKCKELTGDTEVDDYFQLQEANIVTTTPEKWDSMTRKWRDNKSLVQMVRLFLIDEVHVLNDDTRGATMEAVISRMKTVQSALSWTNQPAMAMRFIAISATIPNIEDIAEWLGSGEDSAVFHSLGEKYRPVRLRRVVLGYNCSQDSSDFKFDISLNYKMAGIIHTYSENKPTLVFCSTRKSVQQAASILVKDSKFIMDSQHKERLVRCANCLRDSKLRELVLCGVGYHHAGLELHDRKAVEELFTAADLPVLFATSTLAMGVNLPAHLVVIKSTTQYHMGVAQEYSDTQVLQMIGRAGRPQFDTSATAVIMTKMCNKFKYEALIKGTQLLESSLHKHLIEYLNAEICLRTITDVTVALEWIKSTLLYIRVMKNPKHYDMPVGLTKNQVEKRLQDMCVRNLNLLLGIELINMDEDHFEIQTTERGRMMARFCITYSSMKKFSELSGTVSMSDMLTVLSSCKEFSDIQLRVTERRPLNMLNKDKNRATIRYPMTGKIKSKDMKVNCLIQAQLGSLTIQDFALAQDTTKIFRVAQRVAKCLVEFMWSKPHFQTLLTSVMLCKCLKSRLWENSKFITKQLEGIGPMLSNAFVNAGITSFQKIEETNPRELELIVNRHPPFGNLLRDAVSKLPKYELSIEQIVKYSPVSAELAVTVCLANPESVKSNKAVGSQHFCVLLIGDADNNVILKAKLSDQLLVREGSWRRKISVERANKGNHLDVYLISEDLG
ncbi:probable ATP-dependent DNA helicase HFM1 [Liolophura sinensis]|uniref:probable ATP-dependent DNA helicase HFM1 n=1 Tax=Liolophura sinensis TaxID=3198878 RepID=UPI0031582174